LRFFYVATECTRNLQRSVTGLNQTLNVYLRIKGKGKVIPVQAWRPLVLRKVEAPIFSDIRLIDGGKVVSPRRLHLITYQENSWFSFLLEAKSTPGP
jgi:hypothetical protein